MQEVQQRRTVNIALIGSGFIGKEHAKAYSLAPVSCPEIAATPVKKILCDTVPDKVAERAKLWGFEEYTTDYADPRRACGALSIADKTEHENAP